MSGARLTRQVAMSLTLGLAAWLAPVETLAQGTGPAQAPPSPVAGRVLTLEEAIGIALATEPNIRARLQDYEAARFRVNQALSAVLPQLAGSWFANRQQSQFFSGTVGGGAPKPSPLWSTNSTAQVTLSQILFDFGKTFAATDAARAQAEVSRLDAEVQKDQVILAVKEAYFNLLFGKRLITVNQEAVARAELNLRSAKGFYEVGTRPKFDVTRAEVDLANAHVTLIQAKNAERLARVALNTAMGIDVNTATEVKDVPSFEPSPMVEGQLIPEALRQRPEYRRINALVTAADASVRQAFRNFFPDVSGVGSYGGTFRNPTSPDDLAETWQLGLQLNWSIFDGGNKIARYQEANKNVDAARSRVQAIELSISQEVVQADLNLHETQERTQAAKKAVESAQENFRLAQGRFDAGVGTIIELTDAQLALTQAQSTEAQALTDYRIAVSRLERALGRR
ncbi:MAG: TolC family protein [Candidatus Rokubacteria bacterium]|nr:TolC family protein [Candidatus Rokubacteria bacterium]